MKIAHPIRIIEHEEIVMKGWTKMEFTTGQFLHVKVGDTVTRMMGAEDLGGVPMQLTVTEVTDDLIIANPFGDDQEGWTFDRSTGIEIDHALKWGPQYGAVGTYLVKEKT